MDSTQFGTLIATVVAAGGAIAAAIRWGVKRMARAQDAATTALLENARSHAELAARVGAMHDSIDRVVDILLGLNRSSESSESRRRRKEARTAPLGVRAPTHREPLPDDDDSGDYGR